MLDEAVSASCSRFVDTTGGCCVFVFNGFIVVLVLLDFV